GGPPRLGHQRAGGVLPPLGHGPPNARALVVDEELGLGRFHAHGPCRFRSACGTALDGVVRESRFPRFEVDLLAAPGRYHDHGLDRETGLGISGSLRGAGIPDRRHPVPSQHHVLRAGAPAQGADRGQALKLWARVAVQAGLRRASLLHRRPARQGPPAASKAALVSSSRIMSAAARVSASCSGRLAPTIAEVMPGWARTQATLAVARLSARSAQKAFRLATASNWAACQYRSR